MLKDIKELISDGEDTLLICHYSGHGYGNGGYIGLFGADGDVNFSKEFSLLCLAKAASADPSPPRSSTAADLNNQVFLEQRAEGWFNAIDT